MKSDVQIRNDVEAELEWNPSFDARSIGVAVKDRVVTLTGHVDSYVARLSAEKATQSVAGVAAVANELTVDLPGDAERTDTQIAEAAVAALAMNTSVPATRIKVAVRDGWITLSGDVNLWFEKNEAELAVRSLRGVRGLSNDIAIKTRVAAKEIKAKIESAFQRHAHKDVKAIRVSVGEGVVTLEGEVRTWTERQDAEMAAWLTPGVVRVHDRLVISP